MLWPILGLALLILAAWGIATAPGLDRRRIQFGWSTRRTVRFWYTGIVPLLLCAPFLLSIAAHAETGTGQHVGYITAVETSGAFWVTTKAYVKTDTQSTQEDRYCVTDAAVIEQLRALAEEKARVKVTYTRHWWWSEGCQWTGSSTITQVGKVAG